MHRDLIQLIPASQDSAIARKYYRRKRRYDALVIPWPLRISREGNRNSTVAAHLACVIILLGNDARLNEFVVNWENVSYLSFSQAVSIPLTRGISDI
jgi:hypothetical protein